MRQNTILTLLLSASAWWYATAVPSAQDSHTGPASVPAVNSITPGELVVERPTLICLGFQWYTSGDANKNAKVTLQYRQTGETAWKPALDPWRLCGQRCVGYGKDIENDFYEPPSMFAGSIFDLEPGTEYECRLTMSDPDGVLNAAEKTVKVKTRSVPQPPADSRILHLGGVKSDFTDFRSAVSALKPGDTLLIHQGIYKLSRPNDPDYLENNVYALDLHGTAERPITLKAAGDGAVVFDAQGNYLLFDVQNAEHLILDGLIIKSADFAVYAGCSLPVSNDGIVVRNCNFGNIKKDVQGSAPTTAPRASKLSSGRIRHVGGPTEQREGVLVNPGDQGRVFGTLGDALFGDSKWSKDRCGRASKRRNDLVRPGDTVIVHAGEVLLDHRNKAHWGKCYFYHSVFVMNVKGTAENPITIRGEGNPVYDGVGNYKIFDVQGSEHLIIEGLTFKNADFAVYRGTKPVKNPVVGLTVRNCRFEDFGCGVYGISGANRDILICDNVFVGRCQERYLPGGVKPGDDEASYAAVHLAGQGHVICYNDISRTFDGIQMDSNWATSPMVNTYWTAGGDEPDELKTTANDIYNNLIHFTPDNSIEADMSHHNIRIMRNLCIDVKYTPWSNQFIFGGPAYWIRNIAYNKSGPYKNDANPVGVYSLHNTSTPTTGSYGWPPTRGNCQGAPLKKDDKYVSCSDLRTSLGECAEIFANPPHVPEGFEPTPFKIQDFFPTAQSPAIDQGVEILPNVNDDFAGKAPDLGAIEFGKPLPHYGPRTNENKTQ